MNERNDFEIGTKKFKVGKIDPFKQFHIVRRLGPVLGEVIPAAQRIMKAQKAHGQSEQEKTEEQKFEEIAELAAPVMTGLSKLSDEDANTVLLGLCSAVEIYQEQFSSWARIAVGGQMMIQDLSLPELMQIAGKAFMFNLSGFFVSAHRTVPGGK